jgi:hypothetical protein
VLDLTNEIEEGILVGIRSGLDFLSWYANRIYDYTPSMDTLYEKKKEDFLGSLERT